ncbi:hypothetical protein CAPTEDRAFT_198743 [Capitella teleta]|uniref:Uncharacterized protein n=1 Tax=Capitella teleta TaxID=283909 RepID=R7VB57_CAPTE|nr:hypothetical protein CAPTEDRAFT_198743 [Capitella teleta]|eukprot:ELU12940.1 hypothetical protein CAPTEDRAFT_198743 [Capitella teleta]
MFPKVAFGCLALALLLHLIAMGAPQWARSDLNKMDRKEHIGLWRYCTYPYGGGEACGDFVDIIVGDWLKAAQAFMIFGMLGLIGAVAVVAIIAFVPDFEGDNRILGAGVAVTGAAALFTMIAVGSFGARYQEYFSTRDPAMWGEKTGELHWAWGLALTGFFINLIALGCLVVEVVAGSKDAY